MARLDRLIIVDVEATCWEKNQKPPGEVSEIIEIGICIFDLKLWQLLGKPNRIVVRPTESKVSKYCTSLTGWTQKELDRQGIPFVDACSLLTSSYNTKNLPWASWGDYDRGQFERECKRKDIKYPFNVNHLNLKTLFAIHANISKAVGMKEALQMVGLNLEGKHHSGRDDAWNIGRILEKQGRF